MPAGHPAFHVAVPSLLAESVEADWIASLPAAVGELAARWELRVGEPYEPGGVTSWVAPARTAGGEDVVLKVGHRHHEAEHEADGLRVWAGDGAVRLLAAQTWERTSALLLERCVPGTSLAASLPEPDQDEVVASLLRRLWRRPPAGHPFRPLTEMCDAWADSFERRLSTNPVAVDAGLASEGMALFRELPRTGTDDVLLCTDLHAANILAARREPWLVIDPKPYVGDPAYDTVQHMLNCARLRSEPLALVGRLAGLLDLDAERLRGWAFARCVERSLDDPELAGVATRLSGGTAGPPRPPGRPPAREPETRSR